MVYISALISEYFGMTIKIYLSVIANDHGKEFFTVAIYVVAILYCILLCYILLCGSHSRLIVIVNIDIVIPEPGDHPNPNIQVIGFGIEVELRRLAGGLRVPAEPPHSIQPVSYTHLMQAYTQSPLCAGMSTNGRFLTVKKWQAAFGRLPFVEAGVMMF